MAKQEKKEGAQHKDRGFKLDKSRPKRHFDLSKEGDEEVVAASVTEEVQETVTPQPSEKKGSIPVSEVAAAAAAPLGVTPEKPVEKPAEKPEQKPAEKAEQKPEKKPVGKQPEKQAEKRQDKSAPQGNQKPQDEQPVDAFIPPTHFENEQEENIKKTNWWIYICGGIIIVGLIIWLFCEMHWKAEHQGEEYQAQVEQNEAMEENEALGEEPAIAAETSEAAAEEPAEESPVEETPVTPETPAQPAPTPATPTPANPASAPAVASTPSAPSAQASPAPTADNKPAKKKPHRKKSNPLPAGVDIDTEAEANNVISGKYGNGSERKRNLGEHYEEIQARVNAKKNNGEF